jgi:hypothetical protein
MKKFIPLVIIGVLLLSGLGAVAIPEGDVKQSSVSFSNLTIEEKEEYVSLDLSGTNSVLMRKDHYMIPTQIETFTFPFGTKIKNVHCTPKNIQTKSLPDKLKITPEPVIFGKSSSDHSVQKTSNQISINSWYEYDVRTGLINNERVVIVKVQTFPIQYHPQKNIIGFFGSSY